MRELLRRLVLGLVHGGYRMKSIHAGRVPAEGGALLLPNHVGYADPMLLSATCPRPIRFVMTEEWIDRRFSGRVARLFDTIPILPTRAKDAIRTIGKALEEDTLVGFFPEGQLARTGHPAEPMRGFELIARRAKVPIIPVWLDGLWDSMWSFHHRRFAGKWPHGFRQTMRVVYGEDLHLGDRLGLRGLWEDWRRLSVEALEDRMREEPASSVLRPRLRLAGDGHGAGIDVAFAAQPADVLDQLAANAQQMRLVDFAARGTRAVLEWDPARAECLVFLMLARLMRIQVHLVERGVSNADLGRLLRRFRPESVYLLSGSERGRVLPAVDGVVPRSFEHDLVAACSLAGGRLFPQWVQAGRVVAFTTPHPGHDDPLVAHQDGWRAGSPGRILPGYRVDPGDSELVLGGPSLPAPVRLAGLRLDAAGFLVARE